MATKAETKLNELEKSIKDSALEIERIEGIIVETDRKLGQAAEAADKLNNEANEERKRADVLGGLAEIGKLDSGLKSEFQKVKEKLLKLGESRKTLPSVEELSEKKRLIQAALAAEKDKAHQMELVYPEAVRAVNLEKAEKELVVFMELSEEIAASVLKLALLNDDLEDAIFQPGSGFVLPVPHIEPFHTQAENLHYHQDNLFQYPGQLYIFTHMLKDDLEKARGWGNGL